MQLHALWWWIDRWRKSTAYIDMTLEQQGAYRNLLDEAALRGGPLPNDETVLAKACGDPRRWRKVRAIIMPHFHLTKDGWRHTTLDEVLKESERRAEKQRRWRRARGNDRGNEGGNDIGNAAGNGGGNNLGSPSPSPSPVVQEQIQRRVDEALKEAKTTKAKLELTVSVLAETVEESLRLRAGALLELYQRLFIKHCHGARYHNRMHLDFEKALGLVRTWPDDARLEKLAVLVLTTDDDWIAGTDRGFGVFAAKASWADKTLAAWEVEHGLQAH